MYINIAFPYLRPKQATYARETLQAIIKDVIESDDLDLEVNPRTVSVAPDHQVPLLLTLFLLRFIAFESIRKR